MKYKRLPSKDELHELFEYKDGDLWWRKQTRQRRINKPSGTKMCTGYIEISISNCKYYAHRIIYAMFYNDPMELHIDHINGNKLDNRIENLRLVTQSLNLQNRRTPSSNNKSGFIGVSFSKIAKKYCAQICIDGKTNFIGYFLNPEDAHSAYIKEKRKHHPGCTI